MQTKKVITTIMLLMITLVLTFLFVVPKYQEIQDLEVLLAEKQMQYDVQSDYYNKVLGMVRSIESRQDAIKKVNEALPSEFSVAPLLYFFQKKGSESGLTVKSITFSDIIQSSSNQAPANAQKKELKHITFAMSLSGSYQNLKKFLSSLEKSERLFEVETVSFNSPLSSSNYDVKLEVKTHTY